MVRIYFRTRFGSLPVHSLYNDLLSNPPAGVDLTIPRVRSSIYYKIDRKSNGVMKQKFLYYSKPWPYLLREWYSQRDLTRFDLIYASQHLIFREIPWIADFEYANAFVAYGDIGFTKYILQKKFSSDACKRIMAWSNWAAETMLRSMDISTFRNKLEVVRFAVSHKSPQVSGNKGNNNEKIRILFVGSNNPSNLYNFAFKGGYETIDAALQLFKKYDKIELIMKSAIPHDARIKCINNNNITLIDHDLSNEELQKLYTSSDIFIRVGHETLGPAILEAMSYGLAIVANNIYNIPEAVQDGKTGLLIRTPSIKYVTKNGTPADHEGEFIEGIKNSRGFIAFEIFEKVSKLIEDQSLRRRLGLQARELVEYGEFSTKTRNEKLKRIIEESIPK